MEPTGRFRINSRVEQAIPKSSGEKRKPNDHSFSKHPARVSKSSALELFVSSMQRYPVIHKPRIPKLKIGYIETSHQIRKIGLPFSGLLEYLVYDETPCHMYVSAVFQLHTEPV